MHVPSGKAIFCVTLAGMGSLGSLPPELVGSPFDLASLGPRLPAYYPIDPGLLQDAHTYARRACSLLQSLPKKA